MNFRSTKAKRIAACIIAGILVLISGGTVNNYINETEKREGRREYS